MGNFTFDFTAILQKIALFFEYLITQLIEVVLWIPRMTFSLLVDALNSIFELIPGCDCVDLLQTKWAMWTNLSNSGNLDLRTAINGVLYFLNVLDITFGISVVLSALALRFLIRRIPLIG